MKRVLMVAFHFPPFAGSSGVQRTLRYVQQLPQHGWEPIVLSAQGRAYESTNADLQATVPADVVVVRAPALDAARHLSIGGRYPAMLARPDRWAAWWPGAFLAGWGLIRRYRPHAIWSTFPIPTAHAIALSLQRRSGLPWIADFRDPMLQDDYPSDPRTRRSWRALEAQVLQRASAAVFCTPGAARLYRERYPQLAPQRIAVIENGFDEESFASLDGSPALAAPLQPGALTLLHSGVVYSEERDPAPLFVALGRLRRLGAVDAGTLRIRFRASNNEALLTSLAAQHDVADLVETLPAIPYRAALEEMRRADGLLILQGADCNEQIPAKLYEYLRAGRPILGLTAHEGDTAGALRAAGLDDIAPLESADGIEAALGRFIGRVRSGTAPCSRADFVAGCSRSMRTRELAALLDRLHDRPA